MIIDYLLKFYKSYLMPILWIRKLSAEELMLLNCDVGAYF